MDKFFKSWLSMRSLTMYRVASLTIAMFASDAEDALSLEPPRIHIAIERMSVLSERLLKQRDEFAREIARYT